MKKILTILIMLFMCSIQIGFAQDRKVKVGELDYREYSRIEERVFAIQQLQDKGYIVESGTSDGLLDIYSDKGGDHHAIIDQVLDDAYRFAKTASKFDKSIYFAEHFTNIPEDIYEKITVSKGTKSNNENTTCQNALPFCTDNGQYTFEPNTTGYACDSYASCVGTYICFSMPPNFQYPSHVNYDSYVGYYYGVGSTPAPAFYYMQIDHPGNFDIHIIGTRYEYDYEDGYNLDVDFVCWGPFSSMDDICNLSCDNMVDASFDPTNDEHCYIFNAQQDNYYMLMLTNFSEAEGYYTFQNEATNNPGTTNCSILEPSVSSNSPVCVGETINLTASDVNGATFKWAGPDGWTSTQQNPTRTNATMAMAGTYNCTITKNGESAVSSLEVVVKQKPVANFTMSSQKVCIGTSVSFSNTSTTNPTGGSITSWSWEFGDGGTATTKNPTHTYNTPGYYTVKLTADNGTCDNTKTQTITVLAKPVANFTMSSQKVCIGTSVSFNNTSTTNPTGGTISQWSWDFGDGNTATSQNATHTYSTPGSYTVKLTADNGTCDNTKTQTITVLAQPVADFTFTDGVCRGKTVTFTDASITNPTGNTISQWSWNFGDGSTSNQKNPAHAYNTAGTYEVTLTAGNGTCESSITKTITINPDKVGEFYDEACEEYIWLGTAYNASGDYDRTLQTTEGCDSIVTLHLTINKANHNGSETASACESYLWKGITYTQSGDHTFDTITAHGCDSTVTLHLTINHNDSSYIFTPEPACNSYSWKGETYTQSGYYHYDTVTVNGCDSIMYLDLTVYHDDLTGIETITTCDTYKWKDQEFDESGIHTFDTITTHGCDSTVTLYLTINHSNLDGNVTETACDSYTWNGQEYTQSGDYLFETQTTHGCDSAATLHLTINYSDHTGSETETVCDSYTWNGQTYTTSGNYPFETQTTHGCDSTATLHLTINYSEYPSFTEKACDTYTWNGSTYDKTGIYTFDTVTDKGCERIETLNLTIVETPDIEIIGTHWPIGGSETNFTIYNYNILSFNNTTEYDSVVWTLGCPNWYVEPHNNGMDADVHIFTWIPDSIQLTATAYNECGESTNTIWLRTSYYGIEEETGDLVSITPNPNNGNMEIRLGEFTSNALIKVFDNTGKQVDSFTVDGNNIHYSIPTKAVGIYHFLIIGEEKTIVKKVVVK